jgi:hypothetical protein
MPSTISVAFPQENPAVNRLGTAAPLVFTVAALPFAFLWQSLPVRTPGWRSALRFRSLAWIGTIALVAATLGICLVQNHHTYFRDYARQYRAFVPNTREIASAMREKLEQGFPVKRMFVLGYPHWIDGRNVGFALEAPDWYLTNSIEPQDRIPGVTRRAPLLFVLHPGDARRRQELEKLFPGGAYEVVESRSGHDFALYSISPA